MSTPSFNTSSKQFELSLQTTRLKTLITMNVSPDCLTTANMPHVSSFLKSSLPSIFHSTCYNPQNLAFSEEMKRTELAHLYEHILLEYLAEYYKRHNGNTKTYRGVTSWDWRKNPKGVFSIRINAGEKEQFLLSYAISKTNTLMNEILLIHNSVIN